MARVRSLYPSHESGGGKHNPKPSSFSRAEFLGQQRNTAGFPWRKGGAPRLNAGSDLRRQGHRGRPAKPGFLPGSRDFCREPGISAGKPGFLPALPRERGRFTPAGPRQGVGTGTGVSVLLWNKCHRRRAGLRGPLWRRAEMRDGCLDTHPMVSGESSCLKPCSGWREGQEKGKSVCFQP